MYEVGRRQQWDFPLGPVFGNAGETRVISFQPQCRFRVEKVMATDTSNNPGMGIAVAQFLVGQKLQRPSAVGATVAIFFGPFSLANGVTWDTCQPGLSIALTINFIQACTFYGNLSGSAAL